MSCSHTHPSSPHATSVRRRSKSQPPNGKENCFWPQIQVRRYSNAISTPFFECQTKKRGAGGGGGWGCDASKGIMHATRSEGAGNTNHFTHLTHLLFCQDTKNTYQANRAFMQGITIHEACSEGLRRGGGVAYMLPASMPALCQRSATASAAPLCSAGCSCVSPAGWCRSQP